MRDAFVGILCTIGVFPIIYKVVERKLDNYLSIVAGVAVVMVAQFPTDRPSGSGRGLVLTPLQNALGETPTANVHVVFALIFFGSLSVVSFLFVVSEGKRSQQRDDHWALMSPAFWRRLHKTCATVMVLAIVFAVVTKRVGWFDDYSVIVGESIAVVAFGVSWLTKGLEIDMFPTPCKRERRA
jgi:hypothetical protein